MGLEGEWGGLALDVSSWLTFEALGVSLGPMGGRLRTGLFVGGGSWRWREGPGSVWSPWGGVLPREGREGVTDQWQRPLVGPPLRGPAHSFRAVDCAPHLGSARGPRKDWSLADSFNGTRAAQDCGRGTHLRIGGLDTPGSTPTSIALGEAPPFTRTYCLLLASGAAVYTSYFISSSQEA